MAVDLSGYAFISPYIYRHFRESLLWAGKKYLTNIYNNTEKQILWQS